jgi:hypothetical protein
MQRIHTDFDADEDTAHYCIIYSKVVGCRSRMGVFAGPKSFLEKLREITSPPEAKPASSAASAPESEL